MTRMERRRRRRRILRIKLATTAAVLALTTASIVALTGGAAETVPEQTPQPPALQAEPVLLVAEHDSTYQPVQMTAEPAQEPEPVEEEDENEKIEAALLEQGYPDIGAPNWEIIVAAAAEQIAGAGLILWTCREGELLENALEACARWGLHFDAVNDSLPSWKKFYGNDTRKVGATEYWDDKAYRVQNGKLMKEVAHEMD